MLGAITEGDLRQADHKARFRRIYAEYERDIRAYCRRRLPTADVEDAVADVFVVLWRRIGRVPADQHARLWLFGVARNVIRNSQRAARRSERLWAKVASLAPTRATGDGADADAMRNHRVESLLAALATLRPGDQELLRLRTWEELTPTEIGKLLGLSPEAAGMRITRAARRLAQVLDRDPDDPISKPRRQVDK